MGGLGELNLLNPRQLLPSLSLDPGYTRQRYSPTANPSFGDLTANTFSTPLDLSYEVDLWGRVRRRFQSARAATLADDRYRSGIVAYLEVVDASRDTLSAERANAQLAGQHLIAAVQLIKALGGGWTEQPVLASAVSTNFKSPTAHLNQP